MKLALNHCGEMALSGSSSRPEPKKDFVVLRVDFCAICRTDAKMWRQGHRDLVLPRVLGHEIAATDEVTGQLYTVWPGQACNSCRYCLEGRENLCEEMRIIGFHSDGGFASYVSIPKGSLISVTEKIEPQLLTFAEPAACVLNCVDLLAPKPNDRVLLYGGGVVGLLAALVCREKSCRVTIIERSQEKITRIQPLCRQNGIELVKDTVAADFDTAINCCDSHIAFSLCISKLRKGGRLGFFSGLEKNEEIDTNLLNLIHYKELAVFGSYGPRKEHMQKAVAFCARQPHNLVQLIEKIIEPRQVQTVLPSILSGNDLKFIVDFTDINQRRSAAERSFLLQHQETAQKAPHISRYIAGIIAGIKPVSENIRNQAQKKVDLKTKPLDALGKIEKLAVRLSVVQGSVNPTVVCKRMFVFAGDHGVVEEGVSAFPAKVTVQMVSNFLDGGAAINAFCRHYGIELTVVDMGVNGDFADHPLLMKKKVAKGTANFAVEQAMSLAQAIKALERGALVFLEKNACERCDLVGMGEMGIGNSSSAVAIICAVSGMPVEQVVGRGTGVDDTGLARKKEVLEKSLALHRPAADDALDILVKVGGYELAGICGAVLAAASQGCCVVLDGIISTAAGLLAYLLCPTVKEYLVAGHKSVEVGQQAALAIMGLEPVLDLDMRLGEGTGAAITMDLVDLACRMMREMSSFEKAGVDGRSL